MIVRVTKEVQPGFMLMERVIGRIQPMHLFREENIPREAITMLHKEVTGMRSQIMDGFMNRIMVKYFVNQRIKR